MTAPPLARPAKGGGREYVHPLTGRAVPSITTVIKALDKPALVQWSANMAATYAVKNWASLSTLETDDERYALIKMAHRRESGRKADLGTAVHDAVDAWCTGRSMPAWEAGVAPFMDQFVAFLEHHRPEFVENEFTVWSNQHGYAGTGDWMARIGDSLVLGDTKTGKDVYPETALQLEALRRADVILDPSGVERPLPKADRLGVLHLRPRSWSLVAVDPGEDTMDAFLGALAVTHWLKDTAPTVLCGRSGGAA